MTIVEDPEQLVVIIICIVFVSVALIGFACACFYKARYGATQRNDAEPCTGCQLINMGEAACYTGICSECGRTPTSLATKIVIKQC